MTRLTMIAVAGLSLAATSVASAQVIVPDEPGVTLAGPYGYEAAPDVRMGVAPYGLYGYGPYGYRWGALNGQCSTDEGYGRRGSCETTGH